MIKEVLNLEFLDYTTQKPMLYADYASNTSIESSAERLDLRGGQGNYKLLSFDHTKNMTMKMELPLVDLEMIAYLTGKAIKVGATTVHKRQLFTVVDATPTFTLGATPTSVNGVYIITGDRDNGTEQTLSATPATPAVGEYGIVGAVLKLNATTFPVGSKVAISYDYSAPATTREITFTADKFAGYVTIVGYGMVTDQVDGFTYPTVFKCLKAKAKNNWTITMKSVEATVISLDLDLYSSDVSDGQGGIDKVYVKMYELV